jgi:tetratricopeptide (TPR) repeat protein
MQQSSSPADADPSPSNLRRPWLWAAALVLLVGLVYWPTLANGFIWDDDQYVEANVALRTVQGLHDMWLKWGTIPQYYPLVHTTFWIEYHLWGLVPAGYHAVNMILHAAAVVLLWRVLVRLAVPGAWLAAAIYAVHPVCVETVAWVTERKNVLSCALALGSILAYLRYRPPDAAAADERPKEGWDYAISLSLYIAALLSKTVTATVPAVLAVIYWWKRGRLTRRDWADLAPFVAFGLGLGGVTVWLERAQVGAEGAEWSFSVADRCLIAGRVLWFYAGKLVWPYPIVFFYPRWQIDAHTPWQYLFPAAAMAVIVVLWLARRRIGRGPLAAVLIFAGVLVPALGFFNVFPFRYSFVADHFQYHACVALLALWTAVATLVTQRVAARARWLPPLAAGAVLVPLAILAHQKTYAYKDLFILYGDVLTLNPRSYAAHFNLAHEFDRLGKSDEALAHYRQGLDLLPRSQWHYSDLSHALEVTGQLSEGAAQLEEALASNLTDRERSGTYRRLADILALQGRLDEAIDNFHRALELAPRDPISLGSCAIAEANRGDSEAALKLLDEAIAIDTHSARVHRLRGSILANVGRTKEAIEAFARAVELNPVDFLAREDLAKALLLGGNAAAAQEQIALALQANPRSARAHYLSGQAFLARGEVRAAVAAFEASLRLDPQNAQAAEGLKQAREALSRARPQ